MPVDPLFTHRSVGGGSVSAAATDFGRREGINVIPGGCPLMFQPVDDATHKVMKFVFTLTGVVPRQA